MTKLITPDNISRSHRKGVL